MGRMQTEPIDPGDITDINTLREQTAMARERLKAAKAEKPSGAGTGVPTSQFDIYGYQARHNKSQHVRWNAKVRAAEKNLEGYTKKLNLIETFAQAKDQKDKIEAARAQSR